MRKPANDVAGIEEVNTKQDKIGYTPADDSKVIHKDPDNGNTFENVNFLGKAQKNYKDLLTADQLPSDIARTGQAQTFTAQQTYSIAPVINDASEAKGDNQAATMADLKSVENSAWHSVSVSMANFNIENAFYKKDNTKMTYELFVIGTTDQNGIYQKGILFQDPEVHNFGGINDYKVYGRFRLSYSSERSNYGEIQTNCSTVANKIYYKNYYSGNFVQSTGSLSFYGYIHIVGTFN